MVLVDTPLGEVQLRTGQSRSRELPAHQASDTTQEISPDIREDAADDPTPEQPTTGIKQQEELHRCTRANKSGSALFTLEGRNAVLSEAVSSPNDNMYL